MNRRLIIGILAAIMSAAVFAEVPRIIFDTDMDADYDDVGALAMLHTMAAAGECEIAAIGSCSYSNKSVAVCEIINHYYGRGEIKVGRARIGARAGFCDGYGLMEKYSAWVKNVDCQTAPLAIELYREALKASPDKSVVLCSVGMLNNVADLLASERELVERKVRLWVCMGCEYPKGQEWNTKCDWAASKYAFENWPKTVPIVWSDFQYGRTCWAGRKVAELKDEKNPIKDAFANRLMKREEVVVGESWDQIAGHPAWDQTAVLVAVRGWERYCDLQHGDYKMVGEKGDNVWEEREKSINGRIIPQKGCSREDVGRVIDELMCRGLKTL